MTVTAEQRHSTDPIPVTPPPAQLVQLVGLEPHQLVQLDTGQWRHAGLCPCGFGAAVMMTRRHWAALRRHGEQHPS